jgi:uncharacterized protein
MKSVVYSFLFLLLALGSFAQSVEEIARTKPNQLVNDYAKVLSPADKEALERKLVAYDDSTSTQIAIVLVNTLDGSPIEEAALTIYRAWGIGNKKTNNGVLILAAIEDRKIRIEVGYGLEGAIPDVTANQIIRNDIGPGFRSGDYKQGLEAAANSIIRAAAGEYKAPENYRKPKGGDGGNVLGAIIFFIIVIIVLSNINRKGGGGGFMSRRGYRGFGPTVFWPGSGGGWSGGGGGGGWSGGGGGFGGFGGGSSGGGGASGSW